MNFNKEQGVEDREQVDCRDNIPYCYDMQISASTSELMTRFN